MTDAVGSSDAEDEVKGELIEYFAMASRSLINSR
jgi:hypothetical protein